MTTRGGGESVSYEISTRREGTSIGVGGGEEGKYVRGGCTVRENRVLEISNCELPSGRHQIVAASEVRARGFRTPSQVNTSAGLFTKRDRPPSGAAPSSCDPF